MIGTHIQKYGAPIVSEFPFTGDKGKLVKFLKKRLPFPNHFFYELKKHNIAEYECEGEIIRYQLEVVNE